MSINKIIKMNQLPEIFRQTHNPSGVYRQGPFFNLKLNQSYTKHPSASLEKTTTLTKTRLMSNRHSVDRSQISSRRYIGYSTISYDHLNDPEFIGTKGKKDQSQSYNVLIQQRRKGIQVVGLKVASCRGFKEDFQPQLKQLEEKYLKNLKSYQSSFRQEILQLKHAVSQLRRETGQEIKGMKTQLKDFNGDLLVFVEEFKKVEKHYQKCISSLQKQIK